MATPLDLPLPEITVDNFQRSWTRFELVATAKEWNDDKKKVILPTLLRGKLVDIYMTLNEETRGALTELKKTLMRQAGLLRDPLTASQSFMSRRQASGEKVSDFAVELQKLFTESYPGEVTTSPILLQRFLTGLLPAISRQLLIKGKPTSFNGAIQDASDIEFALTFDAPQEDLQDVNVVRHKSSPTTTDSQTLQSALEQMTKRLEALETKVTTVSKHSRYYPTQRARTARQPRFNAADRVCWLCGEMGHLRRECPLNNQGPARPVGGWPRQ